MVIVGDIMHSRVALSNIYLLKKMGAEVMVAGPPTLIPVHILKHLIYRLNIICEKRLEWCDVANVFESNLKGKIRYCFHLSGNIVLLTV